MGEEAKCERRLGSVNMGGGGGVKKYYFVIISGKPHRINYLQCSHIFFTVLSHPFRYPASPMKSMG